MERILIIGCSGSGKSTLARELGEKLNLTVVHLDRLWWTAGWKNVTQEEFDSRLAMAVNMDRWIIDGNYSRTIEMRLPRCDTIIYLDFDRWLCLWGMFQRVIRNYGKTRPDMGGNCPERFDWEFVKWIWNFNKNNRARYYALLNGAKDKNIVILKSRRQAQKYLDSL